MINFDCIVANGSVPGDLVDDEEFDLNCSENSVIGENYSHRSEVVNGTRIYQYPIQCQFELQYQVNKFLRMVFHVIEK